MRKPIHIEGMIGEEGPRYAIKNENPMRNGYLDIHEAKCEIEMKGTSFNA